MRENHIEIAVTRYAADHGFLSYKFTSPGNRGVPDRIFISKTGAIFFAEFKKIDTTTSRLQEYMLAQLQERGCKTYVIHGVLEGINIINENLSESLRLPEKIS